MLEVCNERQREQLLSRVRAQLHALKRYTYGKHIVARVEKLLSAGTRLQSTAKGRMLPDDAELQALTQRASGPLQVGSACEATATTEDQPAGAALAAQPAKEALVAAAVTETAVAVAAEAVV